MVNLLARSRHAPTADKVEGAAKVDEVAKVEEVAQVEEPVTVEPEDPRTAPRHYPPRRPDFLEKAAMSREMHRL